MNESHMGHFSPFRLILLEFAGFDDRKVNLIVHIHIFYSDSQASWISADITDSNLNITHHL
jgi:hypothetical protein